MTTYPTEFDPDPAQAAATPPPKTAFARNPDPDTSAGDAAQAAPTPPPLPDFAAHAVVRRQGVGIEPADAESMPVLEAFQQFLDTERRRSRNRMLILSAVFSVVLLIVIAGGVAAALSYMRPVQAGLAELQQGINGSERRASRAARRVDQAVEQLTLRERHLREEMGRDKQSIAEAQTSIRQQTDTLQAEMARTRDILRQLQQDNLRLREELRASPTGRGPVAVGPGPTLGSLPPAAPAAATQPAVPTRAERTAATLARAPRAFELRITPVGQDEAVPWRVSVPE